MSITTTTHLNFHGDARAALELYRSVFGGRLTLTTYGDVGMPADAPGASAVVFGQVESDAGFRVMAYDVPGAAGPSAVTAPATRREQGMTITGESCFAASAWSPGFGMLTDAFGVTWILDVA